MKSVSITEKVVSERSKAGHKNTLFDRFAKYQLFKVLSNLKFGHLTIEDEGETKSFGESLDSTDLVAHICVTDQSFYRHVLLGGSIGAGEAYMAKTWWTPDLVKVIRIMSLNMSVLMTLDSRWSSLLNFFAWISHKKNSNSVNQSRKNISAHYDLGNDFFKLFLDPSMLYSAAIYPSQEASLAEASQFKMQHICERLRLKPTDHLLEIGTGWGAMAIFAAKHFGCKVTSVTLSQEQFNHAKQWVAKEDLTNKVEILLKDYRDLEGSFNKLVSIEMIEAVGWEYYSSYFSKCSSLLKPNGLMLIQAITIQDQRYEYAKTHTDFIQQYIFPGGCLPSNQVVTQHIKHDTDMQLVGLEDITLDYARTLADWRTAFFKKIDDVRALGFDDNFIRMWDFYLCYCEVAFHERVISTCQYLFAKPLARELPKIG